MFWTITLIGIVALFVVFWRYASKIELAVQEEQEWLNYINYLYQINSPEYYTWQDAFEEKFLRG